MRQINNSIFTGKTPIRRKQHGFTLIEILVVIVILGVLAMLVVPNVMSRPEQAKRAAAQADIKAISSALEIFRLDNGFYPTTEQGLQALIKQPDKEPFATNWSVDGYLKQLPKDPWGKLYHYVNPGMYNLGGYDLFSFGQNKDQETITDENVVIRNWDVAE